MAARLSKITKLVARAIELNKQIKTLDEKLYLMVEEVKYDHPRHDKYRVTLEKVEQLEVQQREIAYKLRDILIEQVGLRDLI